ncbi:RING finger protein 17-like [Tachyglossus aculeatus]|uniref:RING finger protein 17-like n=1 Tax=Tachyglossus aculeatus TaxID=9261 RepID=UPI0018F79EB1|nr:RING finger protein 17-like [Tachyglossus aculeatus]
MAAAGVGGGSRSGSGWRAARPRAPITGGDHRDHRLRDPHEVLCSTCRSGFAAARGLPVEIHNRNPPHEACFSKTEDSRVVLCPDCESVHILKSGFQNELSRLESVKQSDLVSCQPLLPHKEPEKEMAIRYLPPVLPKESREVSVVVCHVNSPGDFYLRLVEDLDFLLFLKIINDAYKNEYEGENLEILCPVEGQACVAIFEDGVLYRAEVIGFPGRGEVEVKNVDIGRTARIALQDIYKVKDELLSFPRKAIKCTLAHIEPSTRTGPWSTEAKEKFEEMIYGRVLICSVDRILEDNVLLVELFPSPRVPGMMANSVNSELVKEGLACYDPGQVLSLFFCLKEIFPNFLLATKSILDICLNYILSKDVLSSFCFLVLHTLSLYNTLPVGKFWSPDAVELLRELLLPKREVKIRNMASPEHPVGMLSVHLYFAGMSLSYFMAHHKHCTPEGSEDGLKPEVENQGENSVEKDWKISFGSWKISFEELHRPETKIRVLPPYSLLSLPSPGKHFAVQVRHLVVPNEVYVCPEQGDSSSHSQGADERKISWNSEPESLEEGLQHCNRSASSLPFLTDFKTDMPCLAQYSDGLWYRGRIISATEFDPLAVLVQFVDYGTRQKLSTGRLRQIPDGLMRYPAQAVKVTLTGFKPPKSDLEKVRIPYCPSWSMEAVWAMVDRLQGKRLQALTLIRTPEPMVVLYDDERNPVYRPLVDMGLADLDE